MTATRPRARLRDRTAPWTVAALLAALGLLVAACGNVSGSTTIGGSVFLGPAQAEDAFYDPAAGQPLGDAGLVSSQPLDAFDVPDSGSPIVDGSLTPIAESGELQVAAWQIEDAGQQILDCFGYRVGKGDSGAECGRPGPAAADGPVYFVLRCGEGDPPQWRVFTIAETVTALRLEVEGGAPVVGADPEGTGLVAAEATGTVSRITGQTTAGEVRLVEIEAACPAGEAGEPAG